MYLIFVSCEPNQKFKIVNFPNSSILVQLLKNREAKMSKRSTLLPFICSHGLTSMKYLAITSLVTFKIEKSNMHRAISG